MVEVVVVLVPVASLVLVVVELSWAKTVPRTSAPAAPAASHFINLFCFMFVLCFG
jgi:hypothetical protein